MPEQHHPIDKSAMRRLALEARRSIPPEQRAIWSSAICARLRQLLATEKPAALLTYQALSEEVDTTPLFHNSDVQLYTPVTHRHDHMEWRHTHAGSSRQKGIFGVNEVSDGPLWGSACGKTILACPLVGFDRRGNRLGMGKGCFDYWLAEHRSAISMVIGLAFSSQEVAQIPAERHDAPLDYVITELEIIACPAD
ncbi:5-formyltetrahydrofolate cyclo-ligase [Mariprofundus erugo]|uniref:5-formyltetrahydrofolate cyclo-ligase n=1 Tax=Mariprofundus erugo TaxID=2528639 RepID=A0A5R9GTZ0_9PROT|nr:5-formyltetrahydrofolate cyclo-ligase [Mariprofundus erugo]TLS68515.1 5-formyltetrahydrofolate cyclo-ligase [Mariprofundus erugo]